MHNPTGTLYANFSQAISQNKNFKCKYRVFVCVYVRVCVCVCVYERFDMPQVLNLLKNPESVRLCEPEWVQGLKRRPLDPTLNRHILVASHVYFSSVYSSLIFCEAQMENNRKFSFLPVLRYYNTHKCC